MSGDDETESTADELAAMWDEGTPADLAPAALPSEVVTAASPVIREVLSASQRGAFKVTSAETFALTQINNQPVVKRALAETR